MQASTSSPDSDVNLLINGSGLSDNDGDWLFEHSISPRNMWVSEKGKTTGEVMFELGKSYKLELINIFNYNEKWQTSRGVKKADISVWTQSKGWTRVLDDFKFEEAEGRDDYDEPVIVRLDRIEAEKVRFDDMENFGDPEYIGLSEVQFFEIRGPQAANPRPADNSDNNRDVTLSWTPGLNAVAHNLYFGYDANNLNILGRFKGADSCTARLSPLEGNFKCYWRVDEIQSDGSVVKGSVWSFRAGSLLGWWKLDEKDGIVARDCAGSNDGTLNGSLSWRPSDGKIGGALAFDGNDGFLELPKSVGVLGGAFSITFWAYPTEACYYARFLEIGNEPYYDDIFLSRVDTTNNLTLMVWSGEGKSNVQLGRIDASNAIELNKWQFFAATVDNNSVGMLYKNGKQIQRGNVIVPRRIQKEKSYLGKSVWPNDLNYKGMMDDVRIYRYALSESEIRDIYSGKEPVLAGKPEMPRIIGTGIEKTEAGKDGNLKAVLIIFLAAGVLVVITSRRRKKTPA